MKNRKNETLNNAQGLKMNTFCYGQLEKITALKLFSSK